MSVDHAYAKTLPQIEITVIHHDSDGLYSKEMHIPAGVAMGKETHPYSHLSFLAKGRVRLVAGDNEREIEAPACINVQAGVEHAVIALTDAVWFCTHATANAE
jgi:quercetin dioxygenase-like cupin family protein